MLPGLIFYSLALAITVSGTWLLYSDGTDFLGSVLSSAGVGVVAAYVICQFGYLAVMRITRGAPFHVGDQVEITTGEHRGRTGTVEDLHEGRTCVGVSIQIGDRPIVKEILDWEKIRKVKA